VRVTATRAAIPCLDGKTGEALLGGAAVPDFLRALETDHRFGQLYRRQQRHRPLQSQVRKIDRGVRPDPQLQGQLRLLTALGQRTQVAAERSSVSDSRWLARWGFPRLYSGTPVELTTNNVYNIFNGRGHRQDLRRMDH
jgi:hypothetical protein